MDVNAFIELFLLLVWHPLGNSEILLSNEKHTQADKLQKAII